MEVVWLLVLSSVLPVCDGLIFGLLKATRLIRTGIKTGRVLSSILNHDLDVKGSPNLPSFPKPDFDEKDSFRPNLPSFPMADLDDKERGLDIMDIFKGVATRRPGFPFTSVTTRRPGGKPDSSSDVVGSVPVIGACSATALWMTLARPFREA